jgi:hypothetical protein
MSNIVGLRYHFGERFLLDVVDCFYPDPESDLAKIDKNTIYQLQEFLYEPIVGVNCKYDKNLSKKIVENICNLMKNEPSKFQDKTYINNCKKTMNFLIFVKNIDEKILSRAINDIDYFIYLQNKIEKYNTMII